ncbi:hypothetical protein V6Z90_006356 [Aspergillus fumigatus]
MFRALVTLAYALHTSLHIWGSATEGLVLVQIKGHSSSVELLRFSHRSSLYSGEKIMAKSEVLRCGRPALPSKYVRSIATIALKWTRSPIIRVDSGDRIFYLSQRSHAP